MSENDRKYAALVKRVKEYFRRMDMPKGNILGWEDANGRSLDPLVRDIARRVGYTLNEQQQEADDAPAT